MTTEPFTTNGTGDFTNPFTVQPHDCNVSVTEPAYSNSSRTENLPQADFKWCEWHGTCCVNWILIAYCKNQHGRGQNFQCPNTAHFHEYHPITDAMGPYPDTGQQPTSWVDTCPTFPIVLLYTRERRSEADYERIKAFRESFCDMASMVLVSKRRLADAMNDAWDYLCDVQRALDAGASSTPDVIEPEVAKAIELVEISREQMNKHLRYTREVVKLYHDLQIALSNPEYRRYDGDHSTSLTAVNPDTFEEGPKSLKTVFDAFDGPLKGIPELFEWCKRMRRVQLQIQTSRSSDHCVLDYQ